MRYRHVLLSACLVVLPLTACGAEQATTAKPAVSQPAAPALTITDPWVKTTKSGMTAAFGTLANPGAAAITITSATTPAAPRVELHETVGEGADMKMRPKEGGFVIPANGTLDLKPGGDHIMLMDVADPVRPGAEVSFTLTFADGGTMTFKAVAKDFSGANEKYQPGHG
ncbi:copper chaperone PCu(A)C [Nonomuraea sp. NBC_01738]|uniref:copper chaperone PCu(A)C n=1 Tax=Nonomuraea sp. NBC_01738 TaxID=2976003 RepID=UPI002E120178|nr:copper chaperone PCu(A)C [Nonomuraea sp. NBC_01738]